MYFAVHLFEIGTSCARGLYAKTCRKLALTEKENPEMRLRTVGLWVGLGFLAGCAGTPDPAKVAAQQQQGSAQILAKKKQKGSLLLVRLIDFPLLGDVNCGGYITLRKIKAGKPDETEPPVSVSSAAAYRLPNPNKLSLGQLFAATAQRYERWFVPVEPGRYAITYANCSYGDMTIEAGGDTDGVFGRALSYVAPFGGESAITIGQGQIVDAGYVRLTGTRSDPRVVGMEATSAERDLMRSAMPDVYPAITFTKFGM
ncbi:MULTISPECIES: hypothetical protein [unclassified Rhizobium]|uniref:hypothetical protein n=1 Tax=unclassified Rhizobium TaxID=2613769 RepID=UPI001FCE90B4|nr:MULTISPECIES: hypothetical protein [unclassified Rhizobium]